MIASLLVFMGYGPNISRSMLLVVYHKSFDRFVVNTLVFEYLRTKTLTTKLMR